MNNILKNKGVIINFKCCLILFFILNIPFDGKSQSNPFQFVIPHTLKLVDSTDVDGSIIVNYSDNNGIDMVQKRYYRNQIELDYFKNSENKTYHVEYDSMYNVISYGYRKDQTTIGYSFYDSGRLKSYSILYDGTENYLADSSFTVEYYSNGMINRQYYFSRVPAPYKEFWSDGQPKVVTNCIAPGMIYCGEYLEYDETGRLKVKGKYQLVDSGKLPKSRKVGKWKYYEKGKLVKKEKFG